MLSKVWLLLVLTIVVIVSVVVSICVSYQCEGFDSEQMTKTKYVCFPSCKKLLNVLLLAIESFTKHNTNLNILVFNNNELDNNDVNKIKANIHGNNKLYIIDISPWMDIFKDCKPLKGQLNNYIRLLMPLVFRCYFPGVNRFMYCDEDCYCIGRIDKLYNVKLKHEYGGFVDLIPIRNDKFKLNYDQLDYNFVNKNDYINSGLLLFKTSFDLKRLVKYLNMSIIFKLLIGSESTKLCHDQFVLNLYPHDKIPLKINNEYKHRYSNDVYGSELIKQCFDSYNVAHTYSLKNDVNKMKELKIL